MTSRPPLRLYNTLTRQVDPFESLNPGEVRMYTCGPTVHDYAHIGNFRAYVFEDLLRRTLKSRGYRIHQVMNLTDVDDKTIRKARAAGQSLKDYTSVYSRAFFEDVDELGIERAEQYPAATDHVPEMIRMIETLISKGHAYRSDDGSVYFRIESFPAYGKLARLDRDGLKAGARVSQDEYEKESFGDFALWKAWTEDDGDVAWDSPWGRGRPGWHIECSAMSMKYLGESFDIHTGGVDNIFPHHEDEIAQSECATGACLARYWLHCAHLIVDGRKMSKSLGNFFTLRDLKAKGYSGREVRYVLLAGHYRQWLNFTLESLDAARAALRRLDDFYERLDAVAGGKPGDLPSWAAEADREFHEAWAEDLNASEALAAVFDLVHQANSALSTGELDAAGAAAVKSLWSSWNEVLNVLRPPRKETPEDVLRLVDERQRARAAKDWARADEVREELARKGWSVKDTPLGPQVRKL
ncbi:MAG: cysteine--tRNA ligase [Kiritimatiellae bacterium]|nr:cysteine--tRNA ligase [Kiritimatiellia bacterium]